MAQINQEMKEIIYKVVDSEYPENREVEKTIQFVEARKSTKFECPTTWHPVRLAYQIITELTEKEINADVSVYGNTIYVKGV